MNVGVSLPLPPKPPAVSPDPAPFAQEAEALGFESFWVPEHAVAPVHVESYSPVFEGGQVPGFLDPLVALARAAAVTSAIKLGTSVILVPEHNPLVLAKQVATLDRYSGGRCILGVGAGWNKEETAIMGGDPKRPWAQTREAVLVMKALWTQEEAEFHGEFFDFPPVRSFPKPAQRPHPPVYLGGRAKNVMHRVLEWGDGYMPSGLSVEEAADCRRMLDQAAREAGRDPKQVPFTAYRQRADRDVVRRLEDAGADRVVVTLPIAESTELALVELRKAADLVLG